jgi:hypothetical protein
VNGWALFPISLLTPYAAWQMLALVFRQIEQYHSWLDANERQPLNPQAHPGGGWSANGEPVSAGSLLFSPRTSGGKRAREKESFVYSSEFSQQ